MSEYKKIEDGKAELLVTVEGDKWVAARKKAFNKLVKSLQIKGFRKGQVPETLAKKYISDQQINVETASDLCQDEFRTALDEHNVELIDQASLDYKELTNDKVVYSFMCPVKPDVKLGDYKSLKYEEGDSSVSDKEIEDDIKALLDRKADLELKEDGTVENGDTAVIDFEGFKDGKAFDGGKGENYELVIGSGSFIPGFEDQLIGMKPEEEKEINVTFPENYHVEELKNAPVVFKVKVHEIKKKVLPELNDEFIKEQKIEGVNTVDEYKAKRKEELEKIKKSEAENEASQKLLDEFAKICEVNIPQVMIDKEVDQLLNEQAQRLMYQGISMEQYQQLLGQNTDQMKKMLEPSASNRVKVSLCLEELAKAENLEVTDEDVNKQYEDLAKNYNMPIDDVKKYLPVDTIKDDLKLSKAVEFLKNNK